MSRRLYGSLARIADIERAGHDLAALDPAHWATGDYVEGEVVGERSELYRIEDTTGATVAVEAGDRVVGALGERAATLEGVGSWRDVTQGAMQCLTSAGLMGRFTSLSTLMAEPLALQYRGHVMRAGEKVTMDDFALAGDGRDFDVPTVLLVGTSMSAGKTTTGRLVCTELARCGHRVAAVKLTGAGRYRDIRGFAEAGAAEVFDFVDVGLPSTVVEEAEFRRRIRILLRHVAGRRPGCLVAEAGASPLEPYNGAAAIEELGANVRCTILCASDPYAVVGVRAAFECRPDLVTGPAASTTAAVDLVGRLSGLPGLNVMEPGAAAPLRALLARKLGIEAAGAC